VAFEVFLRALWIAVGGAKNERGDLRGALLVRRIDVRLRFDKVPFRRSPIAATRLMNSDHSPSPEGNRVKSGGGEPSGSAASTISAKVLRTDAESDCRPAGNQNNRACPARLRDNPRLAIRTLPTPGLMSHPAGRGRVVSCGAVFQLLNGAITSRDMTSRSVSASLVRRRPMRNGALTRRFHDRQRLAETTPGTVGRVNQLRAGTSRRAINQRRNP
jgi:hypothetical protein